jgi:hypothetical protein
MLLAGPALHPQMTVSQPQDVELAVRLVYWLHDARMPREIRDCQHSLLALLCLACYYQVPDLVDCLLQWLLVHLQPGSEPEWATLRWASQACICCWACCPSMPGLQGCSCSTCWKHAQQVAAVWDVARQVADAAAGSATAAMLC